MKAKATIFAMTEKGLDVVRHLALAFPDLIDRVVIGRDPALIDDSADALAALCRDCGLAHEFRGGTSATISEGGYALAVSWRWLLDVPEDRLIILHDSPLPRYRGFAPIVNALINGEPEIGVTALFGAAAYDRGDILFQSTSPVAYPITIREAIAANAANYLAVVDRVFACLSRGDPLPRTPQDESRATYSIWRDAQDYRIDWTQDAVTIARTIDALGSPYSGARTFDGHKEILIEAATPVPDVVCEHRHVGKVIFTEDGLPIVICGTGLLKLQAARHAEEDGLSCLPLSRFRTRFR